MTIWQILKIGLPLAFILGVALYINSLKNSVETLTEDRDKLLGQLATALEANKEQVQENKDLRDKVEKANIAKALAEQRSEILDEHSQERIDAIQENSKLLEDKIIKSASIAGDDFNNWWAEWMRRLTEVGPANGGSNQDGKEAYYPRESLSKTTEPNITFMAMNGSYAQMLQDRCEDSKGYDKDDLVDETQEGDPSYCRWYVIAIPGYRITTFQTYMEKVLLFAQQQYEWGKYYKDATNHFEEISNER